MLALLSCKSGVHIVVLTSDFEEMMQNTLRASMTVIPLCEEKERELVKKSCQRVRGGERERAMS